MIFLLSAAGPLNSMGLNYMGPLTTQGFFSANILESFLEICDSLKKFTNKLRRLEISKKIKKKLCHECIKIYVDMYTTYRLCVSQLFMLVRLPANSRLLVVKFGSIKSYAQILVSAPNLSIGQGSTLLKFPSKLHSLKLLYHLVSVYCFTNWNINSFSPMTSTVGNEA